MDDNGNPLSGLPPEWQHRVQRGVRQRLIEHQLGADSHAAVTAHRAFLELVQGVRFSARRPHEIAIVLVIRPFDEARLDVPGARLARFLSGPVLPFTLRRIARQGWAPGIAFVGLAKGRERTFHELVLSWGPAVITASLALIAIRQHAGFAWKGAAIASACLTATLALVRWVNERKLRIRSAGDLSRMLERVNHRAIGRLTLYRAHDSVWRDTVLELAKQAALIVADVGQRSDGLQWELSELGKTHTRKLVAWAINPAYGFGSGKLADTPPDVPVKPIFTLFGESIVEQIFQELVPRRREYDAEVARRVLSSALTAEPWAEDFWLGVAAVGERQLEDARTRFDAAWAAARSIASWRSLYPGFALLDTLAAANESEPPVAHLVELAELLVRVAPHLRTVMSGLRDDLDGILPNRSRESDEAIGSATYLLLQTVDARDEPPVALWQFRALLADGIRSLLLRGVMWQV